jgi:imidazolonepropionase-like amidohydrolase
MNARFAVDPWFPSYTTNREIGITTEHVTPGLLNLMSGSGVVVKMRGMDLDMMVRKEPSAQVFTLTQEAARYWGRTSQIPVTLQTAAHMIRETLTAARRYLEKNDPHAYEQRLEALRPALEGRIPVIIHALSAEEIREALKLAAEFNLRAIISGGTEAYKLAQELASAKVPVILGDSASDQEAIRGGGRGYDDRGPLLLSRAGVKVGFFGMSASRRGQPTGRLGGEPALNAMWVFRNGVSEDEAMKMATLYPAEMLGIADRIGSIEVGKDADFIVLPGHPFDYRVLPDMVLIDGRLVHGAERTVSRGTMN